VLGIGRWRTKNVLRLFVCPRLVLLVAVRKNGRGPASKDWPNSFGYRLVIGSSCSRSRLHIVQQMGIPDYSYSHNLDCHLGIVERGLSKLVFRILCTCESLGVLRTLGAMR